MQPFTLWIIPPGPNPWKVVIILEELGLPYTMKPLGYAEVKQEPYISLNPNGRVPTLEDPNTGITIWESGVIIEYLIDAYDKDNKISYSTTKEKWQLKQWLMFQMSGQGPYFGQAAWFAMFHPEQIPSAQDRYCAEVKRVVGVLDKSLQGKDYLVGDKCTYADLAFWMWNNNIEHFIFGKRDDWKPDDFPNYKRWFETLGKRPSVKKALEEQEKAKAAMAAH